MSTWPVLDAHALTTHLRLVPRFLRRHNFLRSDTHMRVRAARSPNAPSLSDSAPSFPRSELRSRNARVPFVATHRRAHTMMAWHVHQAGPNLVAAKVPLMLNPPRRRAHDVAPSASRHLRLRRPLRRHPRRQCPRWWRPQRRATAAARRAGWRCGYRVRYTRRS